MLTHLCCYHSLVKFPKAKPARRASPLPVRDGIAFDVRPSPEMNDAGSKTTVNMPHQQHVYTPEDVSRSEFIPFNVNRRLPAYDNCGFWEYPGRMGWLVHRQDRRCHAPRCPPGACKMDSAKQHSNYGLATPGISRLNGSQTTVAEKVAFLQAWLFFGALAETYSICGLVFDGDAEVFDTKHLNGLPMRLFNATQASQSAGSAKIKEQLYAIIRQVQLMMTRASEWEDEHQYTLEECEILFSIHILLRVISLALLCHYQDLGRRDEMNFSVADMGLDWKPEGQMSMMAFTHSRLFARGSWCRSEMWHVLRSFDVSTFACYLDRPSARLNHEACTDTTCMAYQVNEEDYSTLHVNADCNCTSIRVNSADLRDVLARNMIPAIQISEDHFEMEVVEAESHPYIAISHVWADGLGNPFDNSLPKCQIQRLLDFITNLTEAFTFRPRRVALWIDTLCIPVAPHLREYRKAAIRLLDRTYAKAEGVLVLDRELCSFESRRASILELSIRLTCSGWLKRLWTLQEASVSAGAEKLYIQMSDGPAQWSALSQRFFYGPSRSQPSSPIQAVKMDLVYGTHLIDVMDRIPSLESIREPRFDTKLEMIIRAVQNRSTSKREDEVVCAASLLGLDLSEILSVEDVQDRMERFYYALGDIPSGVIFSEFGVPGFAARNLGRAPFRWAPASLLALERPMELSLAVSAHRFSEQASIYGRCEKDGLHIRHIGFVFTDPQAVVLQKRTILVDTTTSKSYLLSLALSENSPDSVGPLDRCALIFKTDICSDVVITAVEKEEESEFRVVIVGHGRVKALDSDSDSDSEVTTTNTQQALCGASTSREQRWCFT
ncbi:hypothetical protein K438DRAFT_1849896 [Mycena galopus ATCC 62051]|nr:hypothetical protein K438DRAFT_1849896 [Mycena galopus ATCC 62051]